MALDVQENLNKEVRNVITNASHKTIVIVKNFMVDKQTTVFRHTFY